MSVAAPLAAEEPGTSCAPFGSYPEYALQRRIVPGDEQTDGPSSRRDKNEDREEPTDLTLDNFFCAGWNERFEERPTEERAVRVPLFRTKLGFLEREVRAMYRFANRADHGAADEHELEVEVDLPLSRRFMLEFSPEQTWRDGKGTRDWDGARWTSLAVLQLVDTVHTAANVQFNVSTPMKNGSEEDATRLGLSCAAFRDLGDRVGFQAHFGHDFLVGGEAGDGARFEMNYAVALTKTLTEETPWLGNLTPSLELAGVTALEGGTTGRTNLSLVPGVQWELREHWWVTMALEVPLTGPRPFEEGLHFSIYREF
jgi:hypothetical protein